MRRIITLFVVLAFAPLYAVAADKPTADEAKKVLDYYYSGKGLGPVLVVTKVCRDIQREGDEKNECSGEITGETLKKAEPVYLWMAYMVPAGDEPQNIIVQYENGGVTRSVKNLQATGSLRYRTWLKHSFDKAGAWTVKVIHD